MKITPGKIVYFASETNVVVAYKVQRVVTEENVDGTRTMCYATEAGNKQQLSVDRIFETEKEAREHILKIVDEAHAAHRKYLEELVVMNLTGEPL
jgi:hypothetical protein